MTELAFHTNFLSGTFPFDEVCDTMDQLEGLHIRNNLFSGTISTSIGKCTKLESIALGTNNFSGTIPSEIGSLKFLDRLLLSNCFRSSDNNDNATTIVNNTIPTEIGKLTNLITLELSNNGFVGDIPSEIGQLTNLRTLLLDGNSFWNTNNLPTELNLILTSLETFNV